MKYKFLLPILVLLGLNLVKADFVSYKIIPYTMIGNAQYDYGGTYIAWVKAYAPLIKLGADASQNIGAILIDLGSAGKGNYSIGVEIQAQKTLSCNKLAYAIRMTNDTEMRYFTTIVSNFTDTSTAFTLQLTNFSARYIEVEAYEETDCSFYLYNTDYILTGIKTISIQYYNQTIPLNQTIPSNQTNQTPANIYNCNQTGFWFACNKYRVEVELPLQNVSGGYWVQNPDCPNGCLIQNKSAWVQTFNTIRQVNIWTKYALLYIPRYEGMDRFLYLRAFDYVQNASECNDYIDVKGCLKDLGQVRWAIWNMTNDYIILLIYSSTDKGAKDFRHFFIFYGNDYLISNENRSVITNFYNVPYNADGNLFFYNKNYPPASNLADNFYIWLNRTLYPNENVTFFAYEYGYNPNTQMNLPSGPFAIVVRPYSVDEYMEAYQFGPIDFNRVIKSFIAQYYPSKIIALTNSFINDSVMLMKNYYWQGSTMYYYNGSAVLNSSVVDLYYWTDYVYITKHNMDILNARLTYAFLTNFHLYDELKEMPIYIGNAESYAPFLVYKQINPNIHALTKLEFINLIVLILLLVWLTIAKNENEYIIIMLGIGALMILLNNYSINTIALLIALVIFALKIAKVV